MKRSDEILATIEKRFTKEIGARQYGALKETLRRLAELPLKS